MNLLALETSGTLGSVALLRGAELAERRIETPHAQSARILPLVDELLAEAELGLRDLDGIVFGRGPGSFTGLRLATAVAQGLALASDVPVLRVSSLAAHAQQAWRTHAVADSIVCVDARMGEAYWAVFAIENGLAVDVGGEHLSRPEALVPPERQPWAALGGGFRAHAGRLGPVAARADRVLAELVPTAQDLLPQAASDLGAGKVSPLNEALPVYLRERGAWRREG